MAFYVTTPIYYVNAAPHLGHAYTTIAADVLARHHRQRGEDVFFLTGTDEHGEPVALAAEALGVTPRELADKNHEHFAALAPILNASNDFFIRTSDPRHVKAVQEVLTRVKDNGYVELGTYEGLYCPRCADFKSDTEVVEGNKCPIHLIELEVQKEENYFFKLSALQERLEQFYEDHPDFVAPDSRRNEALSFIKQGLNDVSLSRGKISWGVPVPWDESHVFYVWFDALLNYYTALSFAREGEDLTDRFWPANVHLVAKDILKFHCVFWPAILMAADLPLPKKVFVHGYLLMDGHKMSKSLGNVLDPFAVIEQFGADALRFYLLRGVGFGADGSVSTADFEARYESELANDYGNLASRTIKMVLRYRDGAVPQVPLDPTIAAEFDGLAERIAGLVDEVDLTAALEEIWERIRRLNKYVDDQAPWKLAKEEDQAAELDKTLATLIEGVRTVTTLLLPWIPDRATQLLGTLGATDHSYAAATFGAALPTQVSDLEPLFPKHQAPA